MYHDQYTPEDLIPGSGLQTLVAVLEDEAALDALRLEGTVLHGRIEGPPAAWVFPASQLKMQKEA